jgi:hypothetical protein
MKGTWQTTDGGGTGLAVPLAVGAAVLAAAVAGPVLAAVADLLRAVFIILAAAVVLALAGGAVAAVYRLRHPQPRIAPPGVIHARPVRPVQDRTGPRVLAAPREVHIHLHDVSAEDMAAIIRQARQVYGRGPEHPPLDED